MWGAKRKGQQCSYIAECQARESTATSMTWLGTELVDNHTHALPLYYQGEWSAMLKYTQKSKF